jgi:photosystem II stability/assembly factor-like uncharacterized protein
MTRFAEWTNWCAKRTAIPIAAAAIFAALPAQAQQIPPSAYQEMRWRSIGPYRGGRTRALCGVASKPSVFYIGGVDSGVWRSDDFGETWTPIFDDQDTGSIGAIAVAPSDPNIIYVGSGEGLPRPDLAVGDGMYKSTDEGKTWTHLGLHDAQQIANIVVDPNNPNRLFVSVLGHPYGPNPERGIYRSTDGGQSFQKVLGRDDNTGGNDVEMDPSNPNILYASLWSTRQAPWEDGNTYSGPGGLFKSTDGGDNWKPLTNGLPEGVQQVDIAIAPSNPSRIYATVAFARGVQIFRSDDAGETWTRATTDTRPALRIGGGDLPVPKVDPKNPDVLYTTSTVTWRSSDGGKTWTGIRGAPGGDDYQNIWINPNYPEIILLVSDQGALVSENYGRTWTSWYNQPTAQLYHVVADNGFPYRLCAGQQDSGSLCIASRGNDGEITFRDWHPVGVIEYGYAVPDPKNPNIIYGAGRNDVTKYHWDTGQVEKITPIAMAGAEFRTDRTQPIIFSPVNNTTIYFAANVLFKTEDGGHSWTQISPDLTREHPGLPESVGDMAKNTPGADAHRGTIYSVAPSFRDINTIWIGTDDGQFQMTRDGGKTWKNLTPADLKPWSKVTQMTASHFDEQTAYASVSRFRVDDLHPYIYRTHDGGKSWKLIVNGIADGAAVDSVREDPVRKGLLYAATENAVWISWDDGDNWQSLQLNLPHTANRDLWIHDSCAGAAAAEGAASAAHAAAESRTCSRDLIDATHGRGFWILDDIAPLEQMNAQSTSAAAHLYKPELAYRYRRSTNTDTPLPPETPAGQNPPDGAIINYSLGSSASGPVVLEIHDSAGKLVRRYSSDDKPEIDPTELERTLGVPTYWVRMPQVLSAQPGMHRFIWDLHYAPLEGVRRDYPISAVPHDTPPLPRGPRAVPGTYTVKLTANGQSQSQPLVVRIDPRVKTPQADLAEQTTFELHIADAIHRGAQAIATIRSLHDDLAKLSSNSAVSEAAAALDKKALAIMGAQGGGRGGRGGAAAGAAPTFGSLDGGYGAVYGLIDSADSKPTVPQTDAVHKLDGQAAKLEADWNHLRTVDLPAFNAQLQKAGLPPITLSSGTSGSMQQR